MTLPMILCASAPDRDSFNMADSARTSDDSGSTKKRKMHTTSDSMDSSFSPPAKRYKFRTTTGPACVFGGKPSRGDSSSTTSNTAVRGPSTSTWGPVHTKRLNFNTVKIIQTTESATQTIYTSLQEQLLRLVLEPLKSHDGSILTASKSVNDDIRKKLKEACTEIDPVVQYMEAMVEDMSKHNIDVTDVTGEEIPAFFNYYRNVELMLQKQEKTKTVRPSSLSEETMHEFLNTFSHMFVMCASNRTSELELDHLIFNVMCLIQKQEGWQHVFRISKRDETRVHFDVCGTRVISETNVLWEYPNYESKEPFLVTASDRYPIVLSENKSHVTERGKGGTKQIQSPKISSYHKKITQVIGQSVSIADKSPFETEDYKIVYHVSLMGASWLVVNRTHIAKSTLKVIKDGCGIPDQNDLDPSYVFESSFFIGNNFRFSFLFLYTTLSLLGKLSHMLLYCAPSVESKDHSLPSVGV